MFFYAAQIIVGKKAVEGVVFFLIVQYLLLAQIGSKPREKALLAVLGLGDLYNACSGFSGRISVLS